MVNNISTEELINSIFSNEENDLLEITKDFSEEDLKILNSFDESFVSEESMHLLNDINLMNFALTTVEEFNWNYSWQNPNKSNLRTIWEFIQKWCKKIYLFLVTLIKKIQLWISGDLKNISEWYKKNKSDIDSAISNADFYKKTITLKIKLPKKINNELTSSLQRLSELIAKSLNNILNNDDIKYSDDFVLSQAREKIGTVAKIKEQMYGKDAKVKDVSLKEFNNEYKISRLLGVSAPVFKEIINRIKKSIKNSKDLLQKTKEASDYMFKTEDQEQSTKRLVSEIRKSMNVVTSIDYFILTNRLFLIKTAYKYAKQAYNKTKD